MSEAIPSWARIGAKVVCVDGIVHAYREETVPTLGEIYTIREVFDQGVRLVEIVNKPRRYSDGFIEARFLFERFRPLVSQADDIAEHFAHHLNIRAPETV